ncbi:MAG: FkbM family methyltransferase [Chitinophagaceae bacterium]|nr:FkbM family methyltransferase [Chitinophagaceae bacterium]
MRPNKEILLKLILNYGFVQGLILFLNLKLNKKANIRVPGIANAIALRRGSSDFSTFYQIFLDKEYETELIKDPKVIIDAGANIGLFSILMKSKFPESIIICVEPDVSNFKSLKENLSKYSNVYFENFALWSTDKKLKVYDKFHMGKWGLIVEENATDFNVEALTINRIIEKYKIQRIDVLKLDIESSEKYLFRENFERWLPITKMILIELHDRFEPDCSRIFFEFVNNHISSYTLSASGENIIVINNTIV